MLKLIFTFLIISFTVMDSYGALGKTFAGGKSAGTAGIRTVQSDVFSVYNNQAAIGFQEKTAFGFHAERRFMVEGLDKIQGAFVLPTSSGVFGLSLTYFGNSNYNERKVGIAYGRKLSENLTLGGQISYLGLNIAEFGQRNTFTFELGVQYFINPDLLIASHIYNPLRITLEDFQEEVIPTVIGLGLRYEPLKNVFLMAETEKDLNQDFRFRFGLDYAMSDLLSVRLGLLTDPASPSLGLGFNVNNLLIDISSFYHPVMGFTPHLSIAYYFGSSTSKTDLTD
ncbi:MAG: hypothetical protein EA412_12215 [Chitinophagaceae bacterium]|nr:MAG: hypothetical protein EA412_12215 [Chitinophagaceae bacterium]